MTTKNILAYIFCLLLGSGFTDFLGQGPLTASLGYSLEPETNTLTKRMSTLPNEQVGLIPKDTAERMVVAYRGTPPRADKTLLVWHDPKELKEYIDSNFLKYTPLVPAPQGYYWKLAITPMFVTEKGKQKLTFCLLPCLVNKTDVSKGYDYFVEKGLNSEVYKQYFSRLYDMIQPYQLRGDTTKGTGFIFDEGQLWP